MDTYCYGKEYKKYDVLMYFYSRSYMMIDPKNKINNSNNACYYWPFG